MGKFKKTNKILLLSISVAALGMTAGCGTAGTAALSDPSAEEEEGKVLQITYTTEDETETRDEAFPENWGFYRLSDISYETVGVTEAPAVTLDMVKVTYSPIVLDSEEYAPDTSIEEDGVEYELSDMEVDSVEDVYVQEVSTYTDYSKKVTSSSVPQTKTASVVNEKTGATQEVVCQLSSVDRTGTALNESHIDIVFQEYDADTFVWGSYTIAKDEESPNLNGTALLKSVGLDTSSSYVTDVYWVGDAYESGGVIFRNARADVMTTGSTYRATYTGSITTTGTVYKMTYTGQKSTEAGTPVYEIAATAVYERNAAAVAGVSAAIVVLAVLIVVLLALLARKRNVQDGTNMQMIENHISNETEKEGDESWKNL